MTDTKRILIFSLAYYPSHVSGAETAIKDTTDRISSDDIEFHLVRPTPPSALMAVSRLPRLS